MDLARPVIALDPRRFGRGRMLDLGASTPATEPLAWLSDDLKLFATTFAAGFIFVSVFIA
ncbi:MAG: hypothetical protein ABIW33_05295 [Sphingomicrobium sp.]